MDSLNRRNPSLNDLVRTMECDPPSERNVRLRSACDACHGAKVKCSGGTTCMNCQISQVACSYSTLNRLGRPKGSKNKRTLLQKREERRRRELGDSDPDACQPYGSIAHQPFEMLTEFHCEQGFDSSFGQNLSDDSMFDHLLNHEDASLANATGNTELLLAARENEGGTLFPKQLAPSSSSQTVHRTYPDDTPQNFVRDHNDHYTIVPASAVADFAALSSSNPSIATPNSSHNCTCLRMLAQLVYQLGELLDFHATRPTIDLVLHGVELARSPWQMLMRCARCRSPKDQKEVFLLLATSIRILLSSIKALDAQIHISEDPDDEISTASPPRSHGNVLLGSFELTGEAKTEVITMLIRRTMRNIASALAHLESCVSVANHNLSESTRNGRSKSPAVRVLERTSLDSSSSQRNSLLHNVPAMEDTGNLFSILDSIMRSLKGPSPSM